MTEQFCLLYEKIEPLLLSFCFPELLFTLQSFCSFSFLLFPHLCLQGEAFSMLQTVREATNK
jgi:hypothetical protein